MFSFKKIRILLKSLRADLCIRATDQICQFVAAGKGVGSDRSKPFAADDLFQLLAVLEDIGDK